MLDDGDVRILNPVPLWNTCWLDTKRRVETGGDRAEFPEYLQWFHYCEGMVMPPVNTIVVQTVLLPPDRRDETALAQAQRLLAKALEPVNAALEGRDYVVGDFSAADIMLGTRVS